MRSVPHGANTIRFALFPRARIAIASSSIRNWRSASRELRTDRVDDHEARTLLDEPDRSEACVLGGVDLDHRPRHARAVPPRRSDPRARDVARRSQPRTGMAGWFSSGISGPGFPAARGSMS
jgi:hypothetical protein